MHLWEVHPPPRPCKASILTGLNTVIKSLQLLEGYPHFGIFYFQNPFSYQKYYIYFLKYILLFGVSPPIILGVRKTMIFACLFPAPRLQLTLQAARPSLGPFRFLLDWKCPGPGPRYEPRIIVCWCVLSQADKLQGKLKYTMDFHQVSLFSVEEQLQKVMAILCSNKSLSFVNPGLEGNNYVRKLYKGAQKLKVRGLQIRQKYERSLIVMKDLTLFGI